MIRNKCCLGCIWWTDRNSKNRPLKKTKDQKLHFDGGPKINLPLQIKKQMFKFSKYRCGIFYPEFGIWQIRYLSLIWSTIPLYTEKITITDYKKELFCFQNEDKHQLQGTTWGEIIRNVQWRSAGTEIPYDSLRYICSGSQPVFGVFQMLRSQILGHKIKCPMSVEFQGFQWFKLWLKRV